MDDVVKKIGKNTIWHLTGKVISTLLSLVFVFLIARLLGPASYGTLSLLSTITMLLQQLSGSGLETSMPYFMQKYKDQTKSLFNYFLKTKTIITVIMSIILYLLSDSIAVFYNNTNLSFFIKIIAVQLILFVLMNVSYFIFQGLNNFKQSMKVDIIFSSTKFISILLVLIGFGVAGALIGYGISYAITTIFAFIVINKLINKGGHFNNKKEFIKYSLIVMSTSLLAFLSNYLINLCLGFQPAELGYFDSANKAGLFLSMLSVSIASSLLPNIVNSSKENINNLTRKFLKYNFFYLAPIAILFISSTSFVINLLLGPDYLNVINLFKVITIALTINSVNAINESIAYGIGKPRKVLISHLIRVTIIIILSNYLTNAFNSSIVLIIAVIASTTYLSYSLKDYVKHPLKDYLKIIISLIPLIIVLNLDLTIIIKASLFTLSGVSYILIVYKRIMQEDDRELIKGLIRKITKSI